MLTKRTMLSIGILGLGLLLSQALAAASLSTTAPLSDYMIDDEPLMLRSISGEYSINVPISDRVKPQSATLNLVLTNSNALKGNRSQVSIYVNDFVVGQIKLDPINTTSKAKFQIEREYLKNGYNKITFKAAQHYTDSQCEDWGAPELWTHIDKMKSTLTLNQETLEVPEKLSALNELINDKLGRYPLSILRAETAVSDHYLYWGSIISQAVKLRLKYASLQLDEKPVDISPDSTGGFAIDPKLLNNDAVLVGTKAQLAQLIPNSISTAIQGPYLGIFRQHHNKTHFILVVSGYNDEQVSAAAQSLALMNVRFPDQQQTVLQPPLLPKDTDLLPPNFILPGNHYPFSQFDYQSNLQNGNEAKLELRLPADLYSTEQKMVSLNLDLAYGAAMRSDSVINIELNGIFVHALQLRESAGAHYQNYQVQLPLRNFKPGPNTLRFKAILAPSISGECFYDQRKNQVITIYPDSTIGFPDAGHVAELPDLKLFANTGFPFAQSGSAGETAFKLLDISSDTIASAWQLISTLAYQQQMPLLDITITQGDIPDTDNSVLIGKLGNQHQLGSLLEGAPVKLGQDNRFPYSFKEQQIANESSTLEWLDQLLFDSNYKPKTVDTRKANVAITQNAGLGDEYLLMSYPKGKGVVLALVSNTENSLYRGTSLLESPELWSQLRGNIFVWDQRKQFNWQQDGKTITVGDGNLQLTFVMLFSKHPWQWLLVIVMSLLALALVTHVLLNKYQRSEH